MIHCCFLVFFTPAVTSGVELCSVIIIPGIPTFFPPFLSSPNPSSCRMKLVGIPSSCIYSYTADTLVIDGENFIIRVDVKFVGDFSHIIQRSFSSPHSSCLPTAARNGTPGAVSELRGGILHCGIEEGNWFGQRG